jgi:protein-L-isoaspartate O-methyltransferase
LVLDISLTAEDNVVLRPTLNINTGQSLFRTHLHGELLEVREHNNYRWFHYGGDVVQAAINTLNRENILLPVPQSMLLFLLWHKGPLNVLNLGMGAGSIENALDKLPNIQVTSVEAELQIIEMAKKYFLSTATRNIFHQNAEEFIQTTTDRYDIILCDIFYQQQSPDCLYISSYYHDLADKLSETGSVFINLYPKNKENLIRIMTAARPYFDYVALVEFKDYQNIVLVLSKTAILSKEELISSNNSPDKLTTTSFEEHINNIHYVPVITN